MRRDPAMIIRAAMGAGVDIDTPVENIEEDRNWSHLQKTQAKL
jgi:hypothetical protein